MGRSKRISLSSSRGTTLWMPAKASFVIAPQDIHISDGRVYNEISPACVARSDVLRQAQQQTAGKVSRVPTNFPAEQVNLWAAYTVAPNVVASQGSLYNALAVLEV